MYKFNKLESIFNKLCYGRQPLDVFIDCLDTYLIPFLFVETKEEFEILGKKLEDKKDLNLIREFFLELGELTEPFSDPLGEFYMLFISHGRMGQYFTPEPITMMMAQLNVGCNADDGQTVLDPACGSGRTLLATAALNRNMGFYGADLDNTCCKMALINLLNNSLIGEIAHMDSISNKFYCSYKTGIKKTAIGYLPYYKLNTESNKSLITLKDVQKASERKPVYKQGSLFGL